MPMSMASTEHRKMLLWTNHDVSEAAVQAAWLRALKTSQRNLAKTLSESITWADELPFVFILRTAEKVQQVLRVNFAGQMPNVRLSVKQWESINQSINQCDQPRISKSNCYCFQLAPVHVQ